jgi:hypothetical protein
MVKQSSEKDFEQILFEAIDETLSNLGESVKTAIYFHLKASFKIKKQEIPYRLGDFSDALERIFGLGARILEISFMKNLHSKIGLVCKWPTWCKWVIPEVTFQEYVCLMKQKFEEAGAKEEEIGVLLDAGEEQEQRI